MRFCNDLIDFEVTFSQLTKDAKDAGSARTFLSTLTGKAGQFSRRIDDFTWPGAGA
jgi:hypothetical protein